jgi:hypothetical protein
MFGILSDLTKAAVGVVVTPVAVAADVLTLGGSATGRNESYTEAQLAEVLRNLNNSTRPSR